MLLSPAFEQADLRSVACAEANAHVRLCRNVRHLVRRANLCGWQEFAKPFGDNVFEVAGGEATVHGIDSAIPFHEGCGHVLAIPCALVDRPSRGQLLSSFVKK